MLKPGQYEYKFLVDGSWKHDRHVQFGRNSFGSINNMLQASLNSTYLVCLSAVTCTLMLQVLAMEAANPTTMTPDSMTNLTDNLSDFTDDVAEASKFHVSSPSTVCSQICVLGRSCLSAWSVRAAGASYRQ
jgi:hypothetical protein